MATCAFARSLDWTILVPLTANRQLRSTKNSHSRGCKKKVIDGTRCFVSMVIKIPIQPKFSSLWQHTAEFGSRAPTKGEIVPRLPGLRFRNLILHGSHTSRQQSKSVFQLHNLLTCFHSSRIKATHICAASRSDLSFLSSNIVTNYHAPPRSSHPTC